MITSFQELIRTVKQNPIVNIQGLHALLNNIELDRFTTFDYEIQIDGDGYSSSITSGFAQSLIDTQLAFSKISKAFETGKTPHRVHQKNKDQLVFEFHEGCTLITVKDCLKLLRQSLEMVKGMSKYNITAICVTIVLVFLESITADLITKYIESEQELAEKKDHLAMAALLTDRRVITGLQVAEQSEKDIQESFMTHAPLDRVSALSFNGKRISKEEISKFQTNYEEDNSTLKTIKAQFLLKTLDASDSKFLRFSAISSQYRVKLVANRLPYESDLYDPNMENRYVDDDVIKKLVDAMLVGDKVNLLVRMEFDSNSKMKNGVIIDLLE